MDNIIVEKLKALEANGEFQEQLANADTLENVQKLLKEYDVEISIEEINGMVQKPTEELSETDLDNVAGGRIIRRVRYKLVRVPWFPWVILVPVYY